MIHIITSANLARFSHNTFAAHLQANGYASLGGGLSGAFVLTRSNRFVWKIGDDPSLRGFSDFVRNSPKGLAIPHIFAMSDPSQSWSVLVVEKLRRLSPREVDGWTSWFDQYVAAKGAPNSDPFAMVATLSALRLHAIGTGLEMDLLKPDNVMVHPQSGGLVLSDLLF